MEVLDRLQRAPATAEVEDRDSSRVRGAVARREDVESVADSLHVNHTLVAVLGVDISHDIAGREVDLDNVAHADVVNEASPRQRRDAGPARGRLAGDVGEGEGVLERGHVHHDGAVLALAREDVVGAGHERGAEQGEGALRLRLDADVRDDAGVLVDGPGLDEAGDDGPVEGDGRVALDGREEERLVGGEEDVAGAVEGADRWVGLVEVPVAEWVEVCEALLRVEARAGDAGDDAAVRDTGEVQGGGDGQGHGEIALGVHGFAD